MTRNAAASLCIALALAGCASPSIRAPSAADKPEHKTLKQRSIALLRDAVRTETLFVRIHAAEALLKTGHPESLRETFSAEADSAGPKYRIGVWRVLAQLPDGKPGDRDLFARRMLAAFRDPSGQDRVHALESLGKLGYGHRAGDIVQTAHDATGPLQAMACWVLANSGRAYDEATLASHLHSKDARHRGNVAYALRFLPRIRPATLSELEAAARVEPAGSEARVYLWGALAMHLPGNRRSAAMNELRQYLETGSPEERFEAGFVIGLRGDLSDIAPLERRLGDKDTDTRIVAAQAILFILGRAHERP